MSTTQSVKRPVPLTVYQKDKSEFKTGMIIFKDNNARINNKYQKNHLTLAEVNYIIITDKIVDVDDIIKRFTILGIYITGVANKNNFINVHTLYIDGESDVCNYWTNTGVALTQLTHVFFTLVKKHGVATFTLPGKNCEDIDINGHYQLEPRVSDNMPISIIRNISHDNIFDSKYYIGQLMKSYSSSSSAAAVDSLVYNANGGTDMCRILLRINDKN